MGNPLQEVFQGRGDKKGHGFWIKRIIPLLFIVSAWLGLLKDFPAARPLIWFSVTSATAAVYLILHLTGKRKEFAIELLFSFSLIIAGAEQALKLPLLKLAFFPFVISMTAIYRAKTVLPLSFLIPFLWLKAFITGQNVKEEILFLVCLAITAILSSLSLRHLRKEKEKAESLLKTIRDNAKDISLDTGAESLSSDKTISHYFALMLKTDEEIRELLFTLKQAVFADSVNLFVPHQNSFLLRSSTEEKGDIIITDKGIVSMCMKDKKSFFPGEVNEKGLEVGYIKNRKILSLIAAPILDGSTSIGVLAADSSRFQAFKEPDRNLLQMFTGQFLRILERERIYPKIKRDYDGLKILKEESPKLVSSLNMDVIVDRLCNGAKKIAFSQVLFFISKGKGFELIHHTGSFEGNKKQFNFKGTFINMIVENKQPIYMADITNYRVPLMPFKTENVRSVMVIPMLYENNLLGLFAMLSEQTGFLDIFQMELLKVLCNQASTSIANAKLHTEIEKLATTDGLTGLYNHRLFQEKMSEQIRRQTRFSEPISLLISDIDYFKKINDTYGHPVGDLVLRSVAKILKETIRDIDIAARYGGEEFAAILPGTDSEGARQISERLRKTVMKTLFSADSRSFKITISIGIATAPSDAKSKEELIEKADNALYHAKHNGRNQSVIWCGIK